MSLILLAYLALSSVHQSAGDLTMFPTASTSRVSSDHRRPSHSPRTSVSRQPVERSAKTSPLPASPAAPSNRPVHYTLILRCPFPRNGFQDPEPVSWDGTKDKALWKIISKTSNSKDIDWEATAERFEVDLSFLMQQAAWLYEQHFEGMKTQMRRLASGGDDGFTNSKPTSSIDISSKRASPVPPPTEPGTPRSASGAQLSRTPSNATLTQSRVGSGLYTLRQRALKSSGGSQYPRPATARQRTAPEDDADLGHDDHDDDDDASDSEDEPSSMARSQAFRRLPSAAMPHRSTLGTLSSEGDRGSSEEDPESSSGGFLPFAAANAASSSSNAPLPDPAATLRGQGAGRPSSKSGATATTTKPRTPNAAPSAPDSSPSASASSTSTTPNNPDALSRPGPLSPRHRAALAAAARGDGSSGTPSMGSSFSDLEDASVTQSALEEAVMSNLQAGGGSIGSRLSSFGRGFGGGRGDR
ncbi:hypothetical protein LTR95_014506 [Oleoguttula sp. CCFEE 5521]